MTHSLRTIAFLLLAALVSTRARTNEDEHTPPCPPPADDAVARWRALRIGLFIHWGPVSLRGTEIGWSRGREVPIDEYDQLYLRFNPVRFDADQWVQIARAAGARYLVFTAKHHDGFCMWDSALTEYDIASTPFGRDVVAELRDACRRQEMPLGLYYSILDWHHPDYPTDSPGGRRRKPNARMDRYVAYLQGQVRELIVNYGPLLTMWFDGEWEEPWTHAHGVALCRYVRRLQPDILINNRVDKARRPGSYRGPFAGDYDTPEQRVGTFRRDRPWESCITLGRQWAWRPNDELKSFSDCVRLVLYTVGGDGNLLLNVGPMPDGRIEPRQVERLHELGRWLAQYGEGIYGTRGGPYRPAPWGVSTCKGQAVYLFVLRWPDRGPLHLPPLPLRIVQARTLTGHRVKVEQTTAGLNVWLAPEHRDEPATAIKLLLDGDAYAIPPIDAPPHTSVHP